MFDPEKRPSVPQSVELLLEQRQAYFDTKMGEDGFSLQEAESLGWNVDLYFARKHFPGRGLVEVHSRLTDEGRYGVLLAVYEEELKEHQRTRAQAMAIFRRLVHEERLQLRALDAAKAAREEAPASEPDSSEEEMVAINRAWEKESSARRSAISHARASFVLTKSLCAHSRLEFPEAFLAELSESKP